MGEGAVTSAGNIAKQIIDNKVWGERDAKLFMLA